MNAYMYVCACAEWRRWTTDDDALWALRSVNTRLSD